MPTLSYTSRRQAVEQTYPIAVMVIAPLAALFLQAYIPLRFPWFNLFDLPLLIVIYASLSRRNVIGGALIGAGIGLAQDALTHLPMGIFGIAKTITGFFAASVSMKLDTDDTGTRFLLTLGFVAGHNMVVYLIQRFLLSMQPAFAPAHEVLRAVLNAGLGLAIYLLLDLFRRRS